MAGGIPQLSRKYRVVAPDLLGHGQSAKPRGDYSLGAFAVWLRDLLDELGISTCDDRRSIARRRRGHAVRLPASGLLPAADPDQQRRAWSRCRVDAATAVSPRRRVDPAGHRAATCSDCRQQAALVVSGRPGFDRPAAAEMWSAYSSLSDAQTRQAFLRTLRSVVDHRGQAVSALNRLHMAGELPTMVIWGDQDRIIPVDHGYAVHDARPGSRLEVLEGVGHFPHVERPSEVVDLIDDFIDTTSQPTDADRAAPHQPVAAVKQRPPRASSRNTRCRRRATPGPPDPGSATCS